MEKGYYSILRVSHLSQIGNFSIEQQKESIQTYATSIPSKSPSTWLNVVQGLPVRESRFRPSTSSSQRIESKESSATNWIGYFGI